MADLTGREDIANDQTSPFGVKPSALGQPVPGAEQGQELANEIASGVGQSIQIGEEALAEDQAQGMDEFAQFADQQEPQDEFAEFADPVAPVGQEQAQGDFQTEPFADTAPQRMLDNLRDLGTRFKASFAVTDTEKRGLLDKTFGKDNVRFRSGEFYIRNKRTDKFRKLDKEGFDLVGDVLDFAREGVEEAVAVPFELGGAVAGSTVPVAGTVAGAAAGRLASAPAQIAVADALGEWLGIDRDPNRKFATEAGIAAAMNTFIPVAGSKMGKILANRRALKAAGKDADHTIMRESSKQLEESVNELKKSGLVQNIPGTDTPMLLWQLHPHDPKAQILKKNLADNPEVLNMVTKQGEAFAESVTELAQRAAGPKAKRAGRIGLAQKVVDIADNIRKKEGEAIGNFRNMVKGTAGKQPLPADETAKSLKGIFDNLGVTSKEGNLVFPKDEQLAGVLGTDSPLIIKGFKQDLIRINNKLATGGGLNIDDLMGLSKLIGSKNKGAGRIGGQYKFMVGNLSSALRKDSRAGMKMILDPEDAKLFDQSMDKFANILDTQKSLARSLNDELSAHSFVKNVLNKNNDGLSSIKAARALLQEESPEVWNGIKGELIDQLFIKHTSDKATGLNSKAFLKDLKGYGPEFLDEFFAGSGAKYKDLEKMLEFGKRLEQTDLKVAGVDRSNEYKKNISMVFIQSAYLKANALLNIITFGNRNKVPLEVMSRDGIDTFLGRVPKKHRSRVAKKMSEVLALARTSGMLAKKAVDPNDPVGRVVGKAQARKEMFKRKAEEVKRKKKQQ